MHLSIASATIATALADSASESLPNILFVLTDDQAPWAMGTAVDSGQYSGVMTANTPHMDRLAAEGVMFRNFFCTTPVCSPARASLMTGRYATDFGIEDFITHPKHKLFAPQRQVALDPDQSVTFAEALKAAGYRTALVGKWHLGEWTLPGNQRLHPTAHGFDYFMGLPSGGTSPSNPELEKDGVVSKFDGLTTDILFDDAISYLQQNRTNPQPFLLCLHTRAPHGAWLPVAPADWDAYEGQEVTIPAYDGLDVAKTKKNMREYLASTSGVDRNLGRLLDAIDGLPKNRETVVVFTSDHGYNLGHNGIWHKGNGIWATKRKPPGPTHNGTRVISNKYRPNLYDLSLKVPMIIRWPGVVRPGTVIDDTASSLDMFPTLVAIGNGKTPLPQTSKPLAIGRDLNPLLRGQEVADWDQDFFAQYTMIHYAQATLRCYRTPKFKLVRDFHNEGRDEFFDLIADPDESVNLIDEKSSAIQSNIERLHAKLIAKMIQLGDPLAAEVSAEVPVGR
ncbi:sulfatase [Stieleria marina]|uniref:Choline-sulfatase n=1 Tax=Stieleria marina TaxID=1930275 RepID=A0A517NVD6_9BACT|nr:Choline-sulfatase [Planctomycetes bacterium K23_9]